MSSLEVRRIHIEAWQSSGKSQAAYCREQGLNTKTFGNWVRKHRAGQVNEPGRMCRPKEAHQSEKWCNALRLLHPTRDGAMITAAQAIIPTGLPDDNETTFI